MAELIVHNPPRAALKASGYIGSPEGDIELTENDKTYNVADFATATTRIPKPPEPTGTKEIIENGVHDVKEYAFADVKIPEPSGTIVLDENNRSYDVTDYAAADVAIPEEEKTVTPSAVKQEITPDNGLLSKVTVLPASLEERTVTPTIVQQTITPEAPAIGLSKVTVGAALPPPILVSKQITENGTYTAENDNADGYSEVTIDIPDQSKNTLNSLIDRSITTITSDVTSIGSGAFQNCTALTEANFSEVTSIGTNAFYGCTALTEAIFPKLTSIGYAAFRYCTALTEANFSEVTFIGDFAFGGCTAIKYFDMSEVDGVPRISTTTFNSTTCIFLFRDQTQLDEYASATNWSALSDRFQIKGVTS